jgi:hypothetical protein
LCELKIILFSKLYCQKPNKAPMKKQTTLFMILFIFMSLSTYANDVEEPVKDIQPVEYQLITDNPKGKLKIRFVSNTDKSDTTNKPKGFFAKLRNVVNSLMDVSDNPPFKIEVVREKEKEKKN